MTWQMDSRSGSDEEGVGVGNGVLRAERRRGRHNTREDGQEDESGSDEGVGDEDMERGRNRASQPAIVCTTDSVKLLVTLLSCLSQGKKDQRIRCDIDGTGMLFTAHSKGKSLQIKTSLGCELFESFEFAGDDDGHLPTQISFALNLNALVESLSMFGPSALATSSLRFSYFPDTALVTLVVEDNGVICECAMQVLEVEDNDIGHLEFEGAFEQTAVVGRCIMQSEPLHDAFAELYDLPSAASVTISMFPDSSSTHSAASQATATYNSPGSQRCMSLSAISESGSCEIEFARTSAAFIEFFCAASDSEVEAARAATFHVAVLQQAFKALAHSNETFLRMNADGFLSVQHMIESGTGDKAFVDALISPDDTSIP